MIRSLRFIPWFIFLFLWAGLITSAQKYHFQNYNVQQGLIQSQVIAITQDKFDNLWFCTLGGVSRFDGKEFTNYSETDGLISNYTTSILADADSNIWIGTAYGISKFNGDRFTNIRFTESPDGNFVRAVKADGKNRIWVLTGGKIYEMTQANKAVLHPVSGSYERISAIQVDDQGNLNAAVVNRGIYRLENDHWNLRVPLPETNGSMVCQRMDFSPEDPGKIFLSTGEAIYTVKDGALHLVIRPGSMGNITNIFQDNSNNLWLTGSDGLFQYSDSGLRAFNPMNGYDGNHTEVIYQDRENNIWLGTSGTGVYRYSYQSFLIFDQFSSNNNNAILPMLSMDDKLFLGTDGEGLVMYDGKSFRTIKGHPEKPGDRHIKGLFRGKADEMFVLSGAGSLTKYNDGKLTPISLIEGKSCINDILPDDDGGFWVASCNNLVHISADQKVTPVMNFYSNRIRRVSQDSVLASTDDGLYIIGPDYKYRKLNDPLLNGSRYMALSSLGKFYLLATSNKGFILYNSLTGNKKQLTTKDGLNGDFIYSVISDGKSQIWLGTGRGVNKINIDTGTEKLQVTSLSIPGDISSAECNQGAAIYDKEKNLWFGTVSGLFKYLPDTVVRPTYLPPVVLQEVQVFSKDISPARFSGLINSWYTIPKNLSLPHNENHLSFSFSCPSYLRSESIQYQYQLEGMEKSWSALTPNHYVVYPALPPGRYTFRARAYIDGVGYSKDNIEFSFVIRAAFYQTLYFKFLMLVFIMGLILWIQWIRMRMRIRQKNEIEEVKREENIRVRQTASEDFHDEVGNSLTRIQVLTDVLHTKLGHGHEEEKRIIGQIKENVSGLYQGTRDILWALNPESDMIREIGHRLESLGIDVFQDTGICFSYENQLGDAENVKLPGNYNRNIMMIFKEAMSNSLKHAQARHVKLKLQRNEQGEILIGLCDDGMGFDHLYIKKGHGFQNMQKRANRIKSFFSTVSSPGKGSRYELKIPVAGA